MFVVGIVGWHAVLNIFQKCLPEARRRVPLGSIPIPRGKARGWAFFRRGSRLGFAAPLALLPSLTEFRKVSRKNAGSMLRLLRLNPLGAQCRHAAFFENGAWTFARVSLGFCENDFGLLRK